MKVRTFVQIITQSDENRKAMENDLNRRLVSSG
jgi:hypothetical protein